MFDAVSAMNGKEVKGAVTVREGGLRGMITLRGDLSSKALAKVCKDLTGFDVPKQGQAVSKGDTGLCWMSPDELLILVPHATVSAALDAIAQAMGSEHHLAADVSDARAQIAVEGPFAREVIAKLAPVDLNADTFGVGTFRRTRLGQVAAAFWMSAENEFEVICFRSVAEYTFGLLEASAEAGPVGHFKTGE